MFLRFCAAFAALSILACSGQDSPKPNPDTSTGGQNENGGSVAQSGGAVVNGGGSSSGGSGGSAGALANGGTAGTTGNVGGAMGDGCATPPAPTAQYPDSTFTPDQDTVAWYKLDDLTDSSPQGLALTNNGAVELTQKDLDWSERAQNGVARFSGSAQSLTRAGLTVGNDFTLEAHVFWHGFRSRTCGAVSKIVALTSGSAGISFEQACGVATGPRVRVNDTTDLVTPSVFEDIADNAWHWVRFVISAGKARFVIDGKALGTPVTVNGLGTSTWTLTLGSNFSGDIDEVRLVKKALPDADLAPSVTARPAYQELTASGSHAQFTATLGPAGAKVVWSKVRGPGNVVFSAPNALQTDATFCMPGTYVIQAIAYQDSATTTDEAVVRVWPEGGRPAPYKVLFLGNSFTFYNGTVGYRFWELEKAAGEAVGDKYADSPYVKLMTSPGQTFQYHWYEQNMNGECTSCTDHVLPAPPTVNLTEFSGKNAQDVIAAGGWDVVVLHSYSTAASRDPDNLFRYGKKLDRLIKRSGARAVFYQTWAYPGVDDTTAEEETLLGNYEELAKQTGAALSRVGRAFKDARINLNGYAAQPNGILFTDNKHPNSFGTYLSASVHFGVIYGKSPVPVAFYPGVGDISPPEISTDTAKADKLRTIAAAYAASTPLQNGQ